MEKITFEEAVSKAIDPEQGLGNSKSSNYETYMLRGIGYAIVALAIALSENQAI